MVAKQNPNQLQAPDGSYYVTLTDGGGTLAPASGGGSGTGGTEYTEDAPAAANPDGKVTMLIRRDTLSASEVSGDGDNVALKGTSRGQAHVYDLDMNTVTGTKTDAKSTATDATSVSIMSVLKQISASVQTAGAQVFGPGTSAAAQRVTSASDDPAVATLGATTGAAVVTDANGTIQQYLRGLSKRWADALGAGTAAAALRVTLASDGPAVAALGTTTDAAVITDSNGSIQQYLRGLVKQWIAGTLVLGTGSNTIGKVNITDISDGEYETVAASQTAQALGATGATGDYISGILVVPGTTSPGNILLLDNATSITVFTGGASSVSNLVPFFIPLGIKSVSGAWKVTTGANVTAIGMGNFT